MRAKLGPEFWECITLRAFPRVKTMAIISNNALHKKDLVEKTRRSFMITPYTKML
jgi:hypothetical protein